MIPGSGRSPGEGEGNATQSSILPFRIPWSEEPRGMQSTGLQEVGHDSATFTHSRFYRCLSNKGEAENNFQVNEHLRALQQPSRHLQLTDFSQ